MQNEKIIDESKDTRPDFSEINDVGGILVTVDGN